MPTYLQKHRPATRQFRERRAKPTGCIVVHTAENTPDTLGVDGGAEAVAAFIARRSDYGSYHILADSDSRIRLVPFSMAAYGDGTGSNEWAIHVSGATTAAAWKRLSPEYRAAIVVQMAQGAVTAARWVKREYGITVPAERITRPQSEAGRPGFISHGERDPGRRSDPGEDFPWDLFLATFRKGMGYEPARKPQKPKGRPDTPRWDRIVTVARKIKRDGKPGTPAYKTAQQIIDLAKPRSSKF
jgi:hypothetical protein